MAASEEQIDDANLNQLIKNLMAIMSPLPHERKAGEEAIKLLEVTDDFGVHLSKITLDYNYDLSLRQLSSVILKQYIQTHWYSMAEKFSPPVVKDIAKSAIRKMLPFGLRDPHSKVRSSIAYAISTIAHWDWPEDWPDLFKCLMEVLAEGEPNSTHGAMRVLTEFIREVTDLHISNISPVFLPEMYRIFTSVELYNIRTRSRAVEIFNTASNMMHAIMNEDKNAVARSILPVLPQFIEAFLRALKLPEGQYSDCGLKKEILKSLNDLTRNFPKYMKSAMSEILPMVWNMLIQSANQYVICEVNSSEDVDRAVDSDGEVIGFNNLVFSIFEFIETFLDIKQYRMIVKKSLNDLFYYLIVYMQITNEQIYSWTESPDQFVEDEDDETFSYSVRISAQDLFMTCCREFKVESVVGICSAIEKHIAAADKMKMSNNTEWWKIYEALLFAVGSVEPLVIECVNSDKNNIFDVSKFITEFVIPCFKLHDRPFLLGRALWFASRFTTSLSDHMLNELLQLTVSALQLNQPAPVRISAVRSIFNYCNHLKENNKTDLLVPFLPSLIEGLIQLVSQATIEILALALETLSITITVNCEVTFKYEQQVIPLAIAVFLKHNNDPLIMSLISEIFEGLAANEVCNISLLEKFLPTVTSILVAHHDSVSQNLVVVCLEILPGIIRNTKPPLPEALVSKVFPAIVNCITASDDNTIVSNGGECIRAFISVSSPQILQWKYESGNGLNLMLQVLSHMLDTKLSEHSAANVGRFVSVMFRECGNQVNTVLEVILRAVLSKLQQAQTLTVAQSLIVIFANLFNHEMTATIDFLCTVPGPRGNSGLAFVMDEWCEKHAMFYGSYESKLCTIALCKILEHGVLTGDERLQNIAVKGEQVFSQTDAPRTRSKARDMPEQWTTVPLLVKIYKILLNELANSKESNSQEEEDDDDEWIDDDDGNFLEPEDNRQTLTELLESVEQTFAHEDFDEPEEDPDALLDPINKIDLSNYLTNFISEFSVTPIHKQHFTSRLTKGEAEVLKSIGVAC